jgi:hypothetical protein
MMTFPIPSTIQWMNHCNGQGMDSSGVGLGGNRKVLKGERRRYATLEKFLDYLQEQAGIGPTAVPEDGTWEIEGGGYLESFLVSPSPCQYLPSARSSRPVVGNH